MRNDAQRNGKSNGFFSLRAISGYLRIASSGASSVATTVRSAGASVASSINDRTVDACYDQVHWAGFDKLECEGGVLRQVLLLGYRSGFQVWDVEEANDVHQLVSRHDGPVSFLQVQKNPVAQKKSEDKFADVRPLLVAASDGSFSGGNTNCDGPLLSCNGGVGSFQELSNANFAPTAVRFYSLRTHAYVLNLKFRSAIYAVRCSPRVVAVSQAAQIHCFDAATLERQYTILTYPIVWGCLGSGGIGYGPLAVGSRWLAYSGAPVSVSNTSRVSPQHLSSAASLLASPANGSLVAHYAKESSKQMAAGIITLGDMGYKKLSKYCSELRPDANNSVKHRNTSFKANGAINGHLVDAENAGMVIVRDIVSKSVIVQFRAHRSPISALCFDPSGTLLVTASVHGHNINVFRVMPSNVGSSSGSDASGSYVHLYRLQRGFTNAVIQDISFSDDSQWIMISSSRGTSHLFAISPSGGIAKYPPYDVNSLISNNESAIAAVRWSPVSGPSKLDQQNLYASGPPVTLSVVSRIRNGNNGWKGTVSGAAAAATGRVSPLSGAIASAFHNCKGIDAYPDSNSLKTKYHLLVFSPSGCVIQYVLRHSAGADTGIDMSSLSNVSNGFSQATDPGFVVEALQKWDVCYKQNRKDRGDNIDIYGEHGNGDSTKFFPASMKRGSSVHLTDGVDNKSNLSADEKHHLYISEAELQMHLPRVPLWTKPEIYFQVMMDNDINVEDASYLGGEHEIERIPTRTIEARSKGLIPVFEYLPMPRFQQPRASALTPNYNGTLLRQKSGQSEDGRHSRRSSCSSIDCMSEGAAVAELPTSVDNNDWGGPGPPAEPLDEFVNSNRDSSNVKARLEFVNTREGPKMEAQLECVNNRESLNMETHFTDDDSGIN